MKLALTIGFLIVLAGCSDQAAKEAVKRVLTDPESARFSEVRPGKAKGNVCGLVNAKNRMGGYVGNTPFLFEKSSDSAELVSEVTDADFKSLWWKMKEKDFQDDFMRLFGQCRQLDRWPAICGTAVPITRHPLCTDLTAKIKERFDH